MANSTDYIEAQELEKYLEMRKSDKVLRSKYNNTYSNNIYKL